MSKVVAQIRYDELSDRMVLDGRDLHCGDCFEVLVCNGLNGSRPEWIETRIEYGEDWFLVGLSGYQISGLFARW